MRIHTTIDSWSTIHDALTEQKKLGRIASHVSFKKLDQHRSTVRPHGWEIQLEAFVRDCGRRAGNSGSYGALSPDADGYAATYDEWGWLLAALFTIDSSMIVGSPKYRVYDGAIRFHQRTALTYWPEELIDILETEGVDPYPIIMGRAARTKRGYFIGRRGADRHTEHDVRPYWSHRAQPRTVAEVREFAFPLGVAA